MSEPLVGRSEKLRPSGSARSQQQQRGGGNPRPPAEPNQAVPAAEQPKDAADGRSREKPEKRRVRKPKDNQARGHPSSEKNGKVMQPTILVHQPQPQPQQPRPAVDTSAAKAAPERPGSPLMIPSTTAGSSAPQTLAGAKAGANQPSASAVDAERSKPAAIKLINEQLQFIPEMVSKLLLDDPSGDFCVIGVIGRQSVGKSTILNLISGHTYGKSDKSTSGAQKKKSPFKVATTDTMLVAQHQTHGVDVHVTPERHILIDCEPIDSASILTRMIRLESPLLPDCKNYETMAQIVGLKLSTWLLSVCNIVIVVDDGLGITNLFKHFEAVQLARWMLPNDISTDIIPIGSANTPAPAGSGAPSGVAASSFAVQYAGLIRKELDKMRHLSDEDIKKIRDAVIRESKTAKRAAAAVSASVPTILAAQPSTSQYDPSIPLFLQERPSFPETFVVLNKQSHLDICSQRFKRATTQAVQSTLARLPVFSSTSAAIEEHIVVLSQFFEEAYVPENEPAFGMSWPTQSAQFRSKILSTKGNSFKRNMSEKEWLRAAGRMWDIVRAAPTISEYAHSFVATLFSDSTSGNSGGGGGESPS